MTLAGPGDPALLGGMWEDTWEGDRFLSGSCKYLLILVGVTKALGLSKYI